MQLFGLRYSNALWNEFDTIFEKFEKNSQNRILYFGFKLKIGYNWMWVVVRYVKNEPKKSDIVL